MLFCMMTYGNVAFMQYFNQILTIVLEVLDDSDSLIRELGLLSIAEILQNQVHCVSFCF